MGGVSRPFSFGAAGLRWLRGARDRNPQVQAPSARRGRFSGAALFLCGLGGGLVSFGLAWLRRGVEHVPHYLVSAARRLFLRVGFVRFSLRHRNLLWPPNRERP